MCHVVTLFLLGQQYRSGGPFRYSEHILKVHKKCFRGIWKFFSAQNTRFCQNIPTLFWASFFQNLNFFHFYWNIIWLVFRADGAVTFFLLRQRSRSGGPFRYPEHVFKVHRKVFRGLWKKVSAQKMRKKAQNRTWNVLTKHCVLNWSFFFKDIKKMFCEL